MAWFIVVIFSFYLKINIFEDKREITLLRGGRVGRKWINLSLVLGMVKMVYLKFINIVCIFFYACFFCFRYYNGVVFFESLCIIFIFK